MSSYTNSRDGTRTDYCRMSVSVLIIPGQIAYFFIINLLVELN